jgi:60 kDa SS-A/Ro ribonucleoprotein
MIRSGSFGRHNVSASVIRRAIQGWFDSKTDEQIFFQSVGSNPSLGDVLKLARVKPRTRHRSALFAYFLGKETCKFEGVSYGVKSNLPPIVSNYENYLKGSNTDLPKAPFEMLTGLSLSSQQWMQVAKVSTWTQLFKSLNTFNRHGVFNDPALTSSLAGKLSNPEVISEAQVFPYQLMSAIKATSPGEISGLPPEMSLALDSALETSLANVPSFEGKNVVICPDVSGSMSSSCTGVRKGSTSVVRAIDVAALVSAALLKKNPHNTVVLPFEGSVVNLKVSPNDSLVETTRKLASIGGGSTNCAAPIQLLNKSEAKVDVLIFISDYEANAAFSMEPDPFSRVLPRSTLMSQEWATLKSKNPGAKLVCIDVTPHGTLQVEDNPDVLHIGGFSDSVFQTMERFVSKGDKVKWVDLIEQIKL